MMRERIAHTLAALDEASVQGEKLASSLGGDIERAGASSAGATSQRLFGSLVAGVGALGAIALSIASGVPIIITAPIGVTIGGALGALLWRGPSGMRVERELHYRELFLERIRQEIERLPPSAPPEVAAELWNEYKTIANGYGRAALARRASIDLPQHLSPAALAKPKRAIELDPGD